jgi:hypothetical protein
MPRVIHNFYGVIFRRFCKLCPMLDEFASFVSRFSMLYYIAPSITITRKLVDTQLLVLLGRDQPSPCRAIVQSNHGFLGPSNLELSQYPPYLYAH